MKRPERGDTKWGSQIQLRHSVSSVKLVDRTLVDVPDKRDKENKTGGPLQADRNTCLARAFRRTRKQLLPLPHFTLLVSRLCLWPLHLPIPKHMAPDNPSSDSTPRKVHSTSGSSYSAGGLEGARSAVLADAKRIPIIPIEVLAAAVLAKTAHDPDARALPVNVSNHKRAAELEETPSEPQFIPSVSESMVDHVLAALYVNGTLSDAGWTNFPTTLRTARKGEAAVFKPLEDLFEHIVDASEFASSNLLRLKITGTKPPDSDGRHNSAEPDGYMILKRSTVPATELSWEANEPVDNNDDIVFFLELKKAATPENEFDVSKFHLHTWDFGSVFVP